MPEWCVILILGIIEGITEFLPVSSTGHMLLAEQWLPHRQTDLFLVVIQSGAVAAVLLVFKQRVTELFKRWRDPECLDYLAKLAVAFAITGAGGLVLKALNFKLPETAYPIGLALLIGGILFVVVEKWLRGRSLNPRVTWSIAIAVGAGQLLAAVFPGTSRSGATILIALLMGLDRETAIEFTFLLGVPTIIAAGGLTVFSHFRHPTEEPVQWGFLALGTIVSGIVGFAAVKWLLRYVRNHTFEGFGWYRIAAGLLVLWLVR